MLTTQLPSGTVSLHTFSEQSFVHIPVILLRHCPSGHAFPTGTVMFTHSIIVNKTDEIMFWFKCYNFVFTYSDHFSILEDICKCNTIVSGIRRGHPGR
jgi:hypothetical protein